MDFHAPHAIRHRYRPRRATGFPRSIIVALVALATLGPLTASGSQSEAEPGGSMVFSLSPQSCIPDDGGVTGIPVFTEDACSGVEHTFALTGPNGVTEEFAAAKDIPSADFEVGPYFSIPDGPAGEGTWTIEDLDHTSGTTVIPSCWNGNAETGMMSTALTSIDEATYSVEWEGAGTTLQCDWFEFMREESSGSSIAAPHPLHLETIPTGTSQLQVGGPDDELVMERVTDERPDIAVPMRLIDQVTGEEISFEADADGSLLITPGEYELINDLSGDTRIFSTSAEGTTIALVGVPLESGGEGGVATTPESGEATADSSETTSVDITVSPCEDIVDGTGVDCTSIDFDEPRPTLDVLVDGEPYADGPIPLEDSGVGMRARIDVPLDSTLTISVADNIPEGYMPAEGYDPLEIAAADVPEGGCGGEATCPVLDIVLVPDGGQNESATPVETTDINITVQTCEDIVDGAGVECTSIDFDEPRPTLDVLVDGEPYADSPVPLEETSVGFRATIDVPLDSTLEISVAENIPDGYVPLEIAVADVPEGGCGGEHACPVLDIILVPDQ